MRPGVNLFFLLLSVLFLFLPLSECCEAAEDKEPLPNPSIQLITSNRYKRQKTPLMEQEAQPLPWEEKIEGCIVTYYDCCAACCGNSAGITYSGVPAVPYETCAVDPALIALGSTVAVDYGDGILHYYRAEDTGSGVGGAHIDVCVSDHEEALALGVRTATVYWMGEPD